jgi:hypothetical protein
MLYIHHDQLPPGRRATYTRFVASIRHHTTKVKRLRLTVGGNLVHYPKKIRMPTAKTSTAKMLFNSTISTRNGRFAALDLKNIYIGTPM